MACSRFNNFSRFDVRPVGRAHCEFETLSHTENVFIIYIYRFVFTSYGALRVESGVQERQVGDGERWRLGTATKRMIALKLRMDWKVSRLLCFPHTQNNLSSRNARIYIVYYARDSDHKMHSVTWFLWPTTTTTETNGGLSSLLSLSSVGRLQRSTNCTAMICVLYMLYLCT